MLLIWLHFSPLVKEGNHMFFIGLASFGLGLLLVAAYCRPSGFEPDDTKTAFMAGIIIATFGIYIFVLDNRPLIPKVVSCFFGPLLLLLFISGSIYIRSRYRRDGAPWRGVRKNLLVRASQVSRLPSFFILLLRAERSEAKQSYRIIFPGETLAKPSRLINRHAISIKDNCFHHK